MHIKKYLLTGLMVWLPLAITLWVLMWLVGLLDGVSATLLGFLLPIVPAGLEPLVRQLQGIPGLGVVLVVTTSKEGAVTGGKDFVNAVSEELIDSIVSDNIPIFSEEEKYNAAIITSLDRIEAKLNGATVPGE